MSTTRVLIFGAGAIGSFLGFRLASSGQLVTLVGRPDFVRTVREHGLRLETFGGMTGARTTVQVVHPIVCDRMEESRYEQRHWDLALLTVKVYDTLEAARTLGAHLPAGTPVLIVQNGVGGEELAEEHLKRKQLISGVMTLSVSIVAPGYIRLETSRGGLNLAPTSTALPIERWSELFTGTGMNTATHRDYRCMKWSKLLLNILANAIPAILDTTPKEVFATPALFNLEKAAFLEALTVMRAMQLHPVAFPGYPVPFLAWCMDKLPDALLRPVLGRLIASGRGTKAPSLQIDLAKRRPQSEVDYLNGAVVTSAARLGLNAPVNRILRDTLMDVTTGRLPWSSFRGQPQKLYQAVQAGGK